MTGPTRRQFGGTLAGAAVLALSGPAGARDTDAPAVRVEISRFRFAPADVTIRPGQRVEWLNLDIAPHTATDDAGGWDTGRLDRGQSASAAFTEPGVHAYRCLFHPAMRGTVTVLDA